MDKISTLTLGSGCFWCTERIFQEVKGVYEVVSGYMGGHVKNPTYKEVCSGLTGHAEVIQFKFDHSIISENEIFELFFLTHDPTTLNQQGNDVGSQYRSVIFYHNESQQKTAIEVIRKIEDQGIYDKNIVTEITKATTFYPAEDYHQDYFNTHQSQPYCQLIIAPKLKKFRQWYNPS